MLVQRVREGEFSRAYGIGAEKDCGTTFGFGNIFILKIIGRVDANKLIDDCT